MKLNYWFILFWTSYFSLILYLSYKGISYVLQMWNG